MTIKSEQVNWRWEFGPAIVTPMAGSLSNVIEEMTYRLFGEFEGREAMVFGRVPVGKPDPENFKSFSDLKPADIQGWMESICSVEGLKAEVIAKLEAEEEDALPAIVDLPFNE